MKYNLDTSVLGLQNNNPIFETKSEPTMSSYQIAQYLEKRHSDVKRSVERLMDGGTINKGTPTAYPLETNGGVQKIEVYHLNERDSYVVVAQLSPEFTAKIVDEWKRLKEGSLRPESQVIVGESGRTLAELYAAKAVQEKELEGLKLEYEIIRVDHGSRINTIETGIRERVVPALNALSNNKADRSEVDNLREVVNNKMNELKSDYTQPVFTPTQIIKELGIHLNPIQFNKFLEDAGVQYKLPPNELGKKYWCLTPRYASQGLVEFGGKFNQMKWTQKGKMFIREIFKDHISPSIFELFNDHEIPKPSIR